MCNLNITTVILALFIFAGLAFAIRHVCKNAAEGKHDCCGCTACNCSDGCDDNKYK